MDIHELSQLSNAELQARVVALEAEVSVIREMMIDRLIKEGTLREAVELEALKIFKERGRNPAIVFYTRQMNCGLKEGLDAIRRITGED